MIGVRLNEDLEKRLNKYVKRSSQNKSSCIKQALNEFLNRKQQETFHDHQTYIGAQQIDQGEGFSLEAIEAYLDTWGSENK